MDTNYINYIIKQVGKCLGKVFTTVCLMTLVATKPVVAQFIPGQQLTTFASPNAMSLSIFDGFPAATSTGVPDINIPLYSINYKDISIPIQLAYNVNLVKPDIHPGWVGLGWNLNAGGAITRVVNDKPDDSDIFSPNVYDRMRYPGTSEHVANVGYYFRRNFFDRTDWFSEARIRTATDDITEFDVQSIFFSIPPVIYDYQPDEFSFSFMGISGSFYLDEKGVWKVRCDQRLRVELNGMMGFSGTYANNTGVQSGGFGKFTITDTKGIKYVFGGSVESVEYSSNLLPAEVAPTVPKTWNLTKIIFPHKDEVTFNYQRGEPIMQPVIELGPHNLQVSYQLPSLDGSIIYPTYLSSITTPMHEIIFNKSLSNELVYSGNSFNHDFNYFNQIQQNFQQTAALMLNPNYALNLFTNFNFMPDFVQSISNGIVLKPLKYYRLDEFTVNDRIIGKEVKRVHLSYSNASSERLKLHSVSFQSANQVATDGSFVFEYNDNMKLPPYLSDKTDLWGFYNGGQQDYQLATGYPATRDANPIYLQTEVLKTVFYPSGGYSAYKFEPNSYSKKINANRSLPLITLNGDVLGGGLRIAEVDKYDKTGQLLNWRKILYVKDYSANSNANLSSGILGNIFRTYKLSSAIERGEADTYNKFYLMPAEARNNGPDINYSEVTELFSDGSYRISNFTNFDNGQNGEYMDEAAVTVLNLTHPQPNTAIVPASLYAFNSKSFMRGKLLRERVFNSTNNLLYDKSVSYTALNQETEYVRNITTAFDRYVENSQLFKDYAGSAFKTYTFSYVPTRESTIVYTNPLSTPITSISDYVYDPTTLNLIRKSTTRSTGQTDEESYLYPPDLTNLSRDPSGVYAAMTNANLISPIIESVKKVDGVQISLQHNDYLNLWPNAFRPSASTVQWNNSATYTTHLWTNYDADGNLLDERKPNGPNVGYLYGYQNKILIATINNAFVEEQTLGTAEIILNKGISQLLSKDIRIAQALNINAALSFSSIPSTSDGASVSVHIDGPLGFNQNFNLCNYVSGQCNGVDLNKTISLPYPGTYSFSLNWQAPVGLTVPMRLILTLPASGPNQSECFLANFEQNGAIGQAHTGERFNYGAYHIPFDPPNSRKYVLQYYYRLNGKWTLMTEPYTGSKNILPAGSDAIDDVRIFPEDAQMDSYTYAPITGITSHIDTKGQTTIYEYDDFQRLQVVRDDKGNIRKKHSYHLVTSD